MRIIKSSEITKIVKELCIKGNIYLGEDVKKSIDVAKNVAEAVKEAAIKTGVARI